MTTIRLQTILFILTAVAIGVGFSNWYLRPEAGGAWLMGTLSLPVLWGIVIFIEQRRPLSGYSQSERRMFTTSVIAAGLMLVTAQSIHLIEFIGLSASDAIDRAWGVTVGVTLVAIGNAIPKVVPALGVKECGAPGTSQKLRRFGGWALVFSGVGYALAWVLLPMKAAGIVATLSCVIFLIALGLRCFMALGRNNRAHALED